MGFAGHLPLPVITWKNVQPRTQTGRYSGAEIQTSQSRKDDLPILFGKMTTPH